VGVVDEGGRGRRRRVTDHIVVFGDGQFELFEDFVEITAGAVERFETPIVNQS
jgi:hypothetical protein